MTRKTTAFVYKWTHIPTGKWYVGSRSRKGCHPDDGYLCSSKVVRPMIVENRDQWVREILLLGDPMYVVMMESELLKRLDAKNDHNSFNQHNGDGKWTTAGKTIPCTEIKRKNISIARTGKATIEKGIVIVITDGKVEKRVPVDSLIPDGWYQGRSDSTNRKIGDSQRGVSKPSVAAALTGKSQTEEHKLNTKNGRIRWKESLSDEEIQAYYQEVGSKISKSTTGVKKTKTPKLIAAIETRKERSIKNMLDAAAKNKGRTWKLVDGKRVWMDKS